MLPYYLDQISFALGVLTGVTGTLTVIGFAVALVTFAGKDTDKRGLSGRHSAGELRGGSLPGVPFPALPVVAPRRRSRRARRPHGS